MGQLICKESYEVFRVIHWCAYSIKTVWSHSSSFSQYQLHLFCKWINHSKTKVAYLLRHCYHGTKTMKYLCCSSMWLHWLLLQTPDSICASVIIPLSDITTLKRTTGTTNTWVWVDWWVPPWSTLSCLPRVRCSRPWPTYCHPGMVHWGSVPAQCPGSAKRSLFTIGM